MLIPITVIIAFITALNADADDKFTINNKTVSKISALRTLLKDPDAEVYKCHTIVLTHRGHIKPKIKSVPKDQGQMQAAH